MRRRGPGYLQRRIVGLLVEADGHALAVADLRRGLGDPDRSNLRRSVRALIRRGSVEEVEVEGRRAVELTEWGLLAATLDGPQEEPDPLAEVRELWREENRLLDERRKRRAEREALWAPPRNDFERWSYPGPVQQGVIAALREHAEPPEEGLPKVEVKRIVGGDAANTRRAIRSLLTRGVIQQTHDGEHLRLPPGSLWWMLPTIYDIQGGELVA